MKKRIIQPSLISDQLRQIINDWPETRYRIAKQTGISESMLSRFMSGERGLSTEALDTLGRYFGLQLVLRTRKQSLEEK